LEVQECVEKFDAATEEENKRQLSEKLENLLDKATRWLDDPDFCIYYLGSRKLELKSMIAVICKRLLS